SPDRKYRRVRLFADDGWGGAFVGAEQAVRVGFDQPGGTLVFIVLAALLVAASGTGAAHHAATGTTTGARATGRGRHTRRRATHARFGRTRGTPRAGSTACGAHALGRTGGRTTATTGRVEPAGRGRATQFAAVGRRLASGGPTHRP